MSFDIQNVRSQFPALEQKINGHSLIYFDSGATSLKPRSVIDRMTQFYSYESANVHRGAHTLSDKATDLYEQARKLTAQFINAPSEMEIIFVRGTTEGINLIASSLSDLITENDEIIISDIEHHANIVPWQVIAEKKNLRLKILEATADGEISKEALKKLLTPQTKILSLTHASNHLGNKIDIKSLAEIAHQNGTYVVVDGAQAVGKFNVDVQDLDADFYVFSGHKMFSPFGIGVVFGKAKILEKMPPYQTGGSMISKVTLTKSTFNDIPFRFEAGTPNIGGAIALGAAIEFIQNLGLQNIESYEENLVNFMLDELKKVPEFSLLGPQSPSRIPLFSLNCTPYHPGDLGFLLNQQGIAVRTGHHCTQPLLQKLKLNGSLRASLSVYNTEEEIHTFINSLKKAKELLK